MAGVLKQLVTDRFAIYNADCMDVLAQLPDDSIHGTIYSPPSSASTGIRRPTATCRTRAPLPEFAAQYGFIIDEVHRVTIPGRTVAVHAAPVPSGTAGRTPSTTSQAT